MRKEQQSKNQGLVEMNVVQQAMARFRDGGGRHFQMPEFMMQVFVS